MIYHRDIIQIIHDSDVLADVEDPDGHMRQIVKDYGVDDESAQEFAQRLADVAMVSAATGELGGASYSEVLETTALTGFVAGVLVGHKAAA